MERESERERKGKKETVSKAVVAKENEGGKGGRGGERERSSTDEPIGNKRNFVLGLVW